MGEPGGGFPVRSLLAIVLAALRNLGCQNTDAARHILQTDVGDFFSKFSPSARHTKV